MRIAGTTSEENGHEYSRYEDLFKRAIVSSKSYQTSYNDIQTVFEFSVMAIMFSTS